jgi:hypothetical protein
MASINASAPVMVVTRHVELKRGFANRLFVGMRCFAQRRVDNQGNFALFDKVGRINLQADTNRRLPKLFWH